jgi:hypothetical protein
MGAGLVVAAEVHATCARSWREIDGAEQGAVARIDDIEGGPPVDALDVDGDPVAGWLTDTTCAPEGSAMRSAKARRLARPAARR